MTIAINCNGTPTFIKSLKLYFPGIKIKVLTGEAMGVAKAVDAANATIIIKGSGLRFMLCATDRAMGATKTVVAVLEIN